MLGVDWNAIRPLDGSQQKGFEELCAQLARLEIPVGLPLTRVGTPDGGVECYVILSDGNELGWQAKYVNALDDSQWQQIDRSIHTALEKHPRLVKYFVCVPWDRPDGRIEGRQSAKDRWDEHLKKWTGWASQRGMTVEFVYWGSSELIDRISRPEFISKYRFWFDARAFDMPWFTTRLNTAIYAAGARYTPEIHVDLPIGAEFEIFGRTHHFFDDIKSHARDIRKCWRFFLSESKSLEFSTEPHFLSLSSKVSEILAELGSIKYQPIGDLPFRHISNQINSTKSVADELTHLLFEKEQLFDTNNKQTANSGKFESPKTNPYSSPRYHLILLSSALAYAQEDLDHGDQLAGNNLMILTGDAGTGKTHLLCDVARQRVLNNHPTILLMGQQFVSHDPPWIQASQQLDLPGMSAEEFKGALEAAAQIAGCRALILVDAINEGAGRQIWPSHLASFLSSLLGSPWIGIVLSVRSSYEDVIIPKEIRSHAKVVTHRGFIEHEYDATRIFFNHYNLELPSAPFLAPEFQNPLFLKTLCEGLYHKGERRLPRGFHGITFVFSLYLGAINHHLSQPLGFNERDPLVRNALEAITKEMYTLDKRWLPRHTAEEIINSFLPGREFERSLYRGLVVEGVITEEIVKNHDSIDEEVIFVNYDRFSDHLIAKMLLDTNLNPDDPVAAFVSDGPLSYLTDKSQFVSYGLLEALCIQVPERVNKELISLVPQILTSRDNIGDAFRQSIVWRATNGFSNETLKSINAVDKQDHQWQNTLDILLTVATLPGHPLNAKYLNKRLRKYSMPARDASWSIYLHNAWRREKSVVHRFVEWASVADNSNTIDDESLDLYSIILAWMFTSSNRFLRDHATKSLVNVLSGKFDATIRLIETFSDVDDPYVAERIYAAAYGVAMRSQNIIQVGRLAQYVYNHVFASGEPPVNILLRDYARGVIERAIFLDAKIEIDSGRIRPPYYSTWPTIPTKKDIEPYLPDESRGAWNGGDLWARNRIAYSILNDDFAFYVIGTNSSFESGHWLSLRLQDPVWYSPEERYSTLLEDLSSDEISALKVYQESDEKLQQIYLKKIQIRVDTIDESSENNAEIEPAHSEESDPELLHAQLECDAAFSKFKTTLSEEHSSIFEQICKDLQNENKKPPRFDLNQIQRYILWRVFDLGWKTEKHGHFDRFTIGFHGRDAKKAERIGKKYQWIALHEIMAFVSDNFQYYEAFEKDHIDHSYVGPWQIHMRDIDPSCIARPSHTKTSQSQSLPAWWAPLKYDEWDMPLDPQEWIQCKENLPDVENLLSIENRETGSRWLNLYGIFTWNQPTPPDFSPTDVERREIWYTITGFLIHIEDTDAFLEWAKNVDLLGYLIPQPSEQRIMLGEYGWAPAYTYNQSKYMEYNGWIPLDNTCPIKLLVAASRYSSGCNGFDCSLEENESLKMPAIEIVKDLGLKWSGNRAEFLDPSGNLAALDPTEDPEDPVCLMIREDLMKDYLAREDLTICWIINGEKRIYGAHYSMRHPPLRIMGAYALKDNIYDGFINYKLEEKSEN